MYTPIFYTIDISYNQFLDRLNLIYGLHCIAVDINMWLTNRAAKQLSLTLRRNLNNTSNTIFRTVGNEILYEYFVKMECDDLCYDIMCLKNEFTGDVIMRFVCLVDSLSLLNKRAMHYICFLHFGQNGFHY